MGELRHTHIFFVLATVDFCYLHPVMAFYERTPSVTGLTTFLESCDLSRFYTKYLFDLTVFQFTQSKSCALLSVTSLDYFVTTYLPFWSSG